MKRYRNVGTSPLALKKPSVQPGEEFDADLSSEQENFLTRIGAIKEAVPDPPQPVEDGE